jgi:hypothetical protein
MHHVTINQKNQKKGRQKECNLPPRKLSPQKVPSKEQEAKEFHHHLGPSTHSRLVGRLCPMSPTTKKVLLCIGGSGAMAATNTNTRSGSGASAYRFERIAAHSRYLATLLVGQHLRSQCLSVRGRLMAFFGLFCQCFLERVSPELLGCLVRQRFH